MPADPDDVVEPSALEKASEQFRRGLITRERKAASEMVRVYGEAWQQVQDDLKRLDAEYQAIKARGEKPSQTWIYEFNRARAFRDQVEEELNRFAQYAEDSAREQMRAAIDAANGDAETLARRALGRAPQGVVVAWNRVPKGAVEAMVGLTQDVSPLHGLFTSISAEGAQAAENALINGLLMGLNPRKTAPLVRDALGVGLSRALRIARTETLRAYREGTRQSYLANRDVVEGWVWHSALDPRTCASCWAMHGTVHKLEETLDDHPNGRCAMVPRTKNWDAIGKQIGVDLSEVKETRAEIEPGAAVFGRLTTEDQIKILGPAKWAAWKEGAFEFEDLVGRKRDPVWGWVRYERSLKDLIGADAAEGYTRLALMGVAKNAGNYSANDLIKVAGIGLRDLTPKELEKVVKHVAEAGFSSDLEKCGTRIAGLTWEGKVIQSTDQLPTGVVHYLRHAIYGQEWPAGTSTNEYYSSLKATIVDQSTKIAVSKYGDFWQVGFWGEDGTWVEYRVKYDYWSTGFRPTSLEDVLNSKNRKFVKWLR